MRAPNALLVAGIALILAGLAGPSLASEDGRTAPEADVVAAEEAAPTPAGEEPAAPGGEDGEGDRVPAEDVSEAGAGEDPKEGREREREKGGEDRGKDDRKRGEKQPLADVGVDMKDISFKPGTVTIKPGDEITWTNRDTAQHDAVGTGDADFDTGLLARGETATVPFNEAGTFDYVCTVHAGMDGKVVVRSSSGGGGSGGKGGTSSGGTGGTSPTDTTSPSGSGGSGGFTSGGSSASGGSLPNTGGAEIPLLLLGAALIVCGLLARAFHEYWIWR